MSILPLYLLLSVELDSRDGKDIIESQVQQLKAHFVHVAEEQRAAETCRSCPRDSQQLQTMRSCSQPLFVVAVEWTAGASLHKQVSTYIAEAQSRTLSLPYVSGIVVS